MQPSILALLVCVGGEPSLASVILNYYDMILVAKGPLRCSKDQAVPDSKDATSERQTTCALLFARFQQPLANLVLDRISSLLIESSKVDRTNL